MHVDGTVSCRIGAAETSNPLRDISVRGCRIARNGALFANGKAIDVTLLGDITVPGRIRWTRAEEIGVEFASRLSDALVRYFTLDRPDARIPDDVLFDAFGRKLPSLDQLQVPGPSRPNAGTRQR